MSDWTFRLTLAGIVLTDEELDALFDAGCDEDTQRMPFCGQSITWRVLISARVTSGSPRTTTGSPPARSLSGLAGLARASATDPWRPGTRRIPGRRRSPRFAEPAVELGRSRSMVRALRALGGPEPRVEALPGLLGRAQRQARSAGAPSAHSRRSVAPQVGRGASARRLTLAVLSGSTGQFCERMSGKLTTAIPSLIRHRVQGNARTRQCATGLFCTPRHHRGRPSCWTTI